MLSGDFTPSCYVFFLGVLLLELLTGEPATNTKKRPSILRSLTVHTVTVTVTDTT
jgi:hypothetical protein